MLTTGFRLYHMLASKGNGSRWCFPLRLAVVREEEAAASAAGTATHTKLETSPPRTVECTMPRFMWPVQLSELVSSI